MEQPPNGLVLDAANSFTNLFSKKEQPVKRHMQNKTPHFFIKAKYTENPVCVILNNRFTPSKPTRKKLTGTINAFILIKLSKFYAL